MIYLVNHVIQRLGIWWLKKAAKKDKKDKKGIAKKISSIIAEGDEGGDYTVYFMTYPDEGIITESILIHCKKYDEHKLIASSYVMRCWDYAMEGARLWEIRGCNLDTALEIPHKLVIDYEIKQIINEKNVNYN
jgi:hypothetical protein